MQERLALEQDLKKAMERQRIDYLQPQVAPDGRVVGGELLMRWSHPDAAACHRRASFRWPNPQA
jgi:EAL domain-containing protein (putative c-di-GMP-specific phosphodiesterase class I)